VTTYQTPNYGIHYCDDLTPVKQLADVITALATDVDSALGRGGVAPYDATSLAAEVAARQSADTALDTRVTTVEGKLTKSYVTPTFANSYAQFSTAPTGRRSARPSTRKGWSACAAWCSCPPSPRPAR
jgi:hypothetical protein